MKKIIIGVLFVLLLAFPSFAADLSNYPEIFLDEVRIIIGRAAKAEDVIGAIDMVASLQQRVGKSRRVEGAVLDTEVDNLIDTNSIIVGGPCINSAAARIMGWPENCLEGFELGKGIIKIYEFPNGKYVLLAAGTTALDTRRVTTVLANYNDYALTGKEMIISELSTTNIEVR